MRNFWALPAILRVALANQHAFSVQDDVLAYPQYEVVFSEDYVLESQALARLANNRENERVMPEDADTDRDSSGTDGGHVAIKDPNLYDSTKAWKKDETKYEYEEMTLDDQRYLCKLPIVDVATGRPDANQTQSKQEEEKELARANDRGWELLQGMQGNCVYFWSGWWSYRYCYGQGVKQFHQLPPSQSIPAYPPVEDPGVLGFTLGAVEEPAPEAEKGLAETRPGQASKALGKLETRGESRYLVQRLGGGTVCDLTGKQRRIEVQFHCNPATSDKISLIKEVATCAYLMVIQTPRLCNDVAFLPPQKDSPNRVSCYPIILPDEVAAYEEDMKVAVKPSVPETQIPNPFEEAQTKAPPSIGGIVLGAHRWISPDEKVQKSAIVGGGKETYVETIADSTGKLLTPEQLKRMGLGDAKNVEKLKKELEKLAGGQGWKLEVFDTPGGREYRGVLLGDEEEEGNKAKAAEVGKDKAKDPADGEGEKGSEETYKDEL